MHLEYYKGWGKSYYFKLYIVSAICILKTIEIFLAEFTKCLLYLQRLKKEEEI